jgi:hypothetical protein
MSKKKLTVEGLGSRTLAISFLAPSENQDGQTNCAAEIWSDKKE